MSSPHWESMDTTYGTGNSIYNWNNKETIPFSLTRLVPDGVDNIDLNKIYTFIILPQMSRFYLKNSCDRKNQKDLKMNEKDN